MTTIIKMDKETTKFFLYFMISFFFLVFFTIVFYQHVLGNIKPYVINKAKKRFENNYQRWEKVFDICYEINNNNNNNNNNNEITIGYYPNLNSLRTVNSVVKNDEGQIIEDITVAYPYLYTLMGNLDISYAYIRNSSYSFNLQGVPGKTTLIVYLTSSEDINALPKNRKWEHRLKDRVYIVQMK